MSWLFAKRLRSFVLLAGAASLILNVALLMPALYTMQVFDRVFASGSVETLVMLSAITLLFLVLSWFLDVARTRSLGLAGRSLDRLLSPAAIRSALEQASNGPGRADADALRDIALLRGLLNGNGVLALFDAPWLPVYLLVITLMHPWLGLAASLGAAVLAAVGVLNDRLTRGHAEAVVRGSRASTRRAEAFACNAEAIVGMGMTGAAIARWQEQHDELLAAQEKHGQLCVRALRARTRVPPGSAGGDARARRVARDRQAGVAGRDDRRHHPARAGAAAGRAPDRRLAGAGRRSRCMAATGRAPRGRAGRVNGRTAGAAGKLDLERVSFALAPARPPLIRNVSFALAARGEPRHHRAECFGQDDPGAPDPGTAATAVRDGATRRRRRVALGS